MILTKITQNYKTLKSNNGKKEKIQFHTDSQIFVGYITDRKWVNTIKSWEKKINRPQGGQKKGREESTILKAKQGWAWLVFGWEKGREGRGEKKGRKKKGEGTRKKNIHNFSNSKDNQTLTAGCREVISHFVPCSPTFPLQSMRTLHLAEFWEGHQQLKNNSAFFKIKRISIVNKIPSELICGFPTPKYIVVSVSN